jgi:uncharacterized membrane protein
VSGCSNRVNVLATLIGLVAVVTGLGGVFANIFYGEGYLALAGLAVSLTNMVLGFILFYWGLMGLWRYSHS